MDFQGPPSPVKTVYKETLLFDTKGFGVTTSRTVIVPLRGVDKDTQ